MKEKKKYKQKSKKNH